MAVVVRHDGRPGVESTYTRELVELLRVLVVAGVFVGIVAIGLGSRLAMLLLRLTSPDYMIGVTSDDGFEIGQVTLAGTYNLVEVGAGFGIVGALAYVLVAPWLVGPAWFRRLTVGLTAGAVVGSQVIHPHGIDFVLLEPRWLAVALFVGLPALVGVLLTLAVDSVAAPGSWTARGPQRWLVPLVGLLLVPRILVVVVPTALLVAGYVLLRRLVLARARRSAVGTWGVRAAFFLIACLGFLALGQDLVEVF
jgi:hypothetical protein